MGRRSTRHRELRENMKTHFRALKENVVDESLKYIDSSDTITRKVGKIMFRTYQGIGMRDLWRLSKIYQHAVWSRMRGPYDSPRHQLEVALYQAGVDLYGWRSTKFLGHIEEQRREIMMDKLRDPR